MKAVSLELQQMALIGLLSIKETIGQKIAKLQDEIADNSNVSKYKARGEAYDAALRRGDLHPFAEPADDAAQSKGKRGGKRTMSPEGRKRIAAATKKRWAAWRKAKRASKAQAAA